MLNNNAALKYYTLYKGLFERTQCFTNGTVILQRSAIKIRYNIHPIKPYTFDTNIEYIMNENLYLTI